MPVSATAREQVAAMSQKDTYRLIVFDPAGTAILLESQGREYRLPQVEIPKFTRPALEVTELLRSSLTVSCVFLFSGVLEAFPETSYFAVLESRDAFRLRPQGMEWFTIHHALSNLLFAR